MEILGTYTGHPTIETPNIDRLALEGLRLTQFYAGFQLCSPSRASLLTGKLPIRLGITGDWEEGVFTNSAIGGLTAEHETWADVLRGKGYATKLVGKWHLGQRPEFLPTRWGFDSYFGIPYSVDMGSSAWFDDKGGTPLPLLENETVIEQPVDLSTVSERYVRAAKSFMTAASPKFALMYASNHVHVPNYASPRFCNTSRRGRYGDAAAELDWEPNTLTIFSSDNGPWLVEEVEGGSAGLFFEGKRSTWEGGLRVPAFLHWPGLVRPGVSLALAASYDVFATILAVAGAEPRLQVDGRDLSPLFTNQRRREVRDCLFFYRGRDLWATRCACSGAHALLPCGRVQFHDPPLLFDVEEDPSEKWALDPFSRSKALETILVATAKHKKSLRGFVPEQDQILLGSNDDFKICGCPDALPNCTCNPENFDIPS
ncbi:hypothetical protein CTAYLR_007739, partial [Chrysophaeum taylorii]